MDAGEVDPKTTFPENRQTNRKKDDRKLTIKNFGGESRIKSSLTYLIN